MGPIDSLCEGYNAPRDHWCVRRRSGKTILWVGLLVPITARPPRGTMEIWFFFLKKNNIIFIYLSINLLILLSITI